MGEIAAAAGERDEALIEIGGPEARGDQIVEGRSAGRQQNGPGREEFFPGAGKGDLRQEIQEMANFRFRIGIVGAAGDALITLDTA
jgi:hypothetical protein